MIRKTFVILFLVVSIVVLFSNREAMAVANGIDGCEPAEEARFDCAKFGPNSIEFLGTEPITINGLPFKKYFYLYTGQATNLIDVAIPLKFTEQIVLQAGYEDLGFEAGEGCSQWYVTGGDPTTGFGAYFSLFGTCRIPPTGSSSPNIVFIVGPSYPDKDNPLQWLVRISKNEAYTGLIVGPFADKAVVVSGGTLETAIGSASYTVVDGEVQSDSGRVLDLDQGKLCLPTLTGQAVSFSKNGQNYTCETLNSITDQCIIGTKGYDPCIWISGKLWCF